METWVKPNTFIDIHQPRLLGWGERLQLFILITLALHKSLDRNSEKVFEVQYANTSNTTAKKKFC